MATYSLFIEEMLVLSVMDEDKRSRIESRAPVDASEANCIIMQWMGLLAAAPSGNES